MRSVKYNPKKNIIGLSERGDPVSKVRQVFYLVLECCIFVVLAVVPGVFALQKNVFRQLPLYRFLEGQAMEDLQTLNPVKDTATNSMVLFLAINNSSVTLIPFTLIGYRVASGSLNPAKPLAGIVIVTSFSTITAVLVTKWLSRRRGYQVDTTAQTDKTMVSDAEGGANDAT